MVISLGNECNRSSEGLMAKVGPQLPGQVRSGTPALCVSNRCVQAKFKFTRAKTNQLHCASIALLSHSQCFV